MGRVFAARDLKLGRDVAIKVLGTSSFDEQEVRRFELEARAAGALNHPNIVAVYDIGWNEGAPYIVSELLQGATLRHRLGKKPLPVQRAVDYALQLAQGLAAAHDKGVIHRDLKPENVFVTSEGRLKILDFGIAKLVLSEAPGATLPSDEARAATPPHKTEGSLPVGEGPGPRSRSGGRAPARAAEARAMGRRSGRLHPGGAGQCGCIHRGQTRRGGAPRFQQLTFRRGFVEQARFGPDQTVAYSAKWDGDPAAIFSTRAGSLVSNPLGRGRLLSVSRSGELLIMMRGQGSAEYWGMGTVARLPLAGGTPRELIEGVGWAEWAPDGGSFAIVRTVEGRNRLEFPPGHVLYETAGEVTHPRFSARGDAIAFLDHPLRGDNRGDVAVVDLAGKKRTLSTGWDPLWGLAWVPGDRELWFTGGRISNLQRESLNAVTLSGRERMLAHLPGHMVLGDVGPDGRALIQQGIDRFGIAALAPGAMVERDFSWFDYSGSPSISSDGVTLLFDVQSAAQDHGVHLRKMDGSPPVLLGEGQPGGLSPDGQWALAWTAAGTLTLLPTGAGAPRPIRVEGVAVVDPATTDSGFSSPAAKEDPERAST
jgi:hypothetical protein